jgi:hypothetical protein
LGVQFLASTGIGILVNVRNKLIDCQRFSVVTQGPRTSRIIQLLDLDRVLSLQEMVEGALSKAKARQAPVAPPAPIPRDGPRQGTSGSARPDRGPVEGRASVEMQAHGRAFVAALHSAIIGEARSEFPGEAMELKTVSPTAKP